MLNRQVSGGARFCLFCLSIGLVMLVTVVPLRAASWGRLNVEVAGYSGSECEPRHRHVLLSGSKAEIVIRITDARGEDEYRGLQQTPPAGVVLQVGLASAAGPEFIPSASLLETLRPTYYVSYWQSQADSVYEVGIPLGIYDKQLKYAFQIDIPVELAGQKLCVRASVEDSVYGHLEGSDCIRIVAPCSELDRNIVLGTYVCFAERRGDYDRAITLADSLIAAGWRWHLGLSSAMIAAGLTGQYDREIEYLDLLYNTYGTVTLQPGAPEAQEQSYREARERIIQLRDQQK